MEIRGGERGNVEDRRNLSGPAKAGGGIFGILVTIGLVYFFGMNPQQAQQFGNVAGQLAGGKAEQRIERELTAEEKAHADFYAQVVGSTNSVWREQFSRNGGTYEEPTLVLYAGSVSSGCGNASSQVGPFYCPLDKKLYLDPTFFDTLEKQLGGSSSKFSQSYVVAHEVGHHVQNLLGYSDLVNSKRRTPEANDYLVRLELMADYLAGCWAHHAGRDNVTLSESDLDSALQSAHAIGDDRLQKRAGRTMNPDEFTHGTSAQRKKYFLEGYNTGDASKRRLDRFFDTSVPSRRL